MYAQKVSLTMADFNSQKQSNRLNSRARCVKLDNYHRLTRNDKKYLINNMKYIIRIYQDLRRIQKYHINLNMINSKFNKVLIHAALKQSSRSIHK